MELIKEFASHKPYALALKFTKNERSLVSAGMDNLVQVWDTSDGSKRSTIAGHTKSANGIDLTRNEKRLVTPSSDQSVRLWSFPEGEQLLELRDRKQVAAVARFSLQDSYIVAGFEIEHSFSIRCFHPLDHERAVQDAAIAQRCRINRGL